MCIYIYIIIIVLHIVMIHVINSHSRICVFFHMKKIWLTAIPRYIQWPRAILTHIRVNNKQTSKHDLLAIYQELQYILSHSLLCQYVLFFCTKVWIPNRRSVLREAV